VGFDVHPADGTPLVLPEPLVDTLDVEEVHAGQPPHVLVRLELGEADRALVRLLLLLLGLASSSSTGLPLRTCAGKCSSRCKTELLPSSYQFLLDELLRAIACIPQGQPCCDGCEGIGS